MTPIGDDIRQVREVLGMLGLEGAHVEQIGIGLASQAWLVSANIDDARAYVLRIAIDAEGPDDATYRIEHAIMRRLRERGAPVPEAVAGSWEPGFAGWAGPPFSLTTRLPGTYLRSDAHDRAIPAIAAFLGTMHGLPVSGFGPPAEVDGRLVGVSTNAEVGILAWSDYPFWPLGGATLATHPALADRPDLRSRLDAVARVVLAALVAPGVGVLVHTDLHEENILDASGHLGFLDFGEAFVAPVAWEFGALAYFLGWALADRVLEAYLRRAVAVDQQAANADAAVVDIETLGADAAAIGLAWGVHRWRQDRDLGLDEDAHDEAFLIETLDRVPG